MTKLAPAEFLTRAIQRVPFRDPRYPQYQHLGVRLGVLEHPFAKYYGNENDYRVEIDSLVRRGAIVAVKLEWGHPYSEARRRAITQVFRLESFPDPAVPDENPMLYLPDRIPRIIAKRVQNTERILAIILRPTVVAANG